MDNLEKNSYLLLTEAQKRIWYTQMLHPDSTMFNIGGIVTIQGEVDTTTLKEAICAYILDNDAFQIRITMVNNTPMQYFSQDQEVSVGYRDFSDCDDAEQFDRWYKDKAATPFSLVNEPLYEFVIFKMSDQKYGYFIKVHHVIGDGWSMKIMTDGISSLYESKKRGQVFTDRPLMQYRDCIVKDLGYICSDKYECDKAYWNEQFESLPDIVPRASERVVGCRETFYFQTSDTTKIDHYCKTNNISQNAFFISLYLLYAYKMTDNEDIVIGTPVLGRSGKAERNIFGMFVNALPFRFQVDESALLFQMMRDIDTLLRRNYKHQKYPFNHLLKDLGDAQNYGNYLYNVCVNYYGTTLCKTMDGMLVHNQEFYNGQQEYSMQIVIRKWHDDAGFQLDIDYKTEEYTTWQVQQLFLRMERLAQWVVEHEQLHVSDLCLLTDEELEIFVKQYNRTDCDYPADTTVVDLFKESVFRNPHKTAVSMNQIALTYRQLDEKSDSLAAFLSSKGIENSCIVPLVVSHSLEAVIAILGVLKTGAAYLPIDPQYPAERISYMLKDSRAELMLSNIAELNTGDFKGEVINLNEASLYSEVRKWKSQCKAKDLAYIIYTSGSTGKPKGVMIDHQNLTHYAVWARKEYVTEETEVFPLYSSLAFDLTVTSIFTPLISGGTIRVYEDNEDEYILKRIVQDGFCTLLKLTPAHMRILKDYDNSWSTIRKLIVGGEQLNADIASSVYDSFSGNIEIFNEYGPTEATVGCMIYRFKNTSNTIGSVPIGRPADNMRIYILDSNLRPKPPGEVGELYISGVGIARGYLNNPELTSERFLAHTELDHQRLYKTGDLAKFIAPDCIEYIGRKDFQLKLNGYRIELNEIEYHLRSYEGVVDAVVTDYKDKDTHYLCAYYVAEKVMDETKLKQHLAQKLPTYMIPHVYIHLKEIPLNINRKVDKALLPTPLIHIQRDRIDRATGDKEAILLSVASELIGRRLDDLDLNYFQAGGDSIIAILMSSRLKDKGYELKAKDILSKPVFGEMVLYMSEVAKEEISQHSCEGFIPLTPIINWFMEQNLRFPGKYCQRVQIILSPEFTVDALEVVLQRLVNHHDTLRANWSKRENKLFYNPVHQNISAKIHVLDQEDRTGTKDLQLDEELLVYSSLHLGGERNIWEITIHHLVIDGVSWRIMLEDLDSMLQQQLAGQPLKLPNKTHSYQEWAKAVEAVSDQFDHEYEYWENALDSSFSYPIVNSDYSRDDIAAATFQLDKMLTESLLSQANRSFHTKPDELLIAALLIALQEITGQTDLLIELENHGRGAVAEQLDISRSVGWFTALYPFRVILEQELLSEQIKAIKEALRSVPNNGVGYGWCMGLNHRWQWEKPRIRFNYLGRFQSEYNSFSVLPCLFDAKANPNHTALLQIDCLIIDQQLKVAVSGSKRNVEQDTTRAFLQIFEQTIQQIIDFCSNTEKVEYTPSDFDGVQLSQKELDNLLS